MCGRLIQSSAPIRYAIVDGMNVRDSRVHNYPPRWNGAPSQDLLVIRRNHKTGEVSLDALRWGLTTPTALRLRDPLSCVYLFLSKRFKSGLFGFTSVGSSSTSTTFACGATHSQLGVSLPSPAHHLSAT